MILHRKIAPPGFRNIHCPLPVHSSAYRQGHSTETALVKVQSDILRNMENQKVTLLVLIDLSATFDTVDHDIAMNVLQSKYGICGPALEWHTEGPEIN